MNYSSWAPTDGFKFDSSAKIIGSLELKFWNSPLKFTFTRAMVDAGYDPIKFKASFFASIDLFNFAISVKNYINFIIIENIDEVGESFYLI